MSKFLKEPIYSPRQLEQQWLNNTVQSHALICGCEEPFNHLQYLLKKEKCHLTKDIGIGTNQNGNEDADDFVLDDGDLQKLFDAEQEDIR